MSWQSKVMWSEGLFLQPHHFQQQDRYTETMVAGLAGGLVPYGWGVSRLALDEELLKLGKLAVTDLAGITPDGAPFRAPASDALPEALDVPDGIANSTVLLSLPIRRPGALEIDASGSGESAARFTASEVEITDTMGSDRRPVTLAVGRMQLALALDVDDLADRLTIPIARIIEKQPDGAVVIDKAFLPSCLDLRASPTLHGFVNELVGILTARLDALAGRLSEGGAKAGAEITDFLLLMTVNRALPRLRHLHGIETVHPVALYQDLVGLAGELATYVAPEKRPPEFPPYRHDDLTATFQPVMRVLRQYLSAEIGRRATLIALEPRKYGISTGIVPDRRLVSTATFVLAAKADVEAENMRRHFPGQVKIGPVEQIRQLVNSALPGIGLRALPVAPRQIPFHTGVVYFELDRASPYWQQLSSTGGIAVHVAGDFPGLAMELWAIPEG